MDAWWTQLAMAAAGGSLGAASRFLVGRALAGTDFPWATVCVNLLGCFLLGTLIGATDAGSERQRALRTTLGTGFLGAFTTFSTFSVEAIELAEKDRWLASGAYLFGQLLLGLALALAGLAIGRTLRGLLAP